ncbi:MAG: HAMP domain-containing histidine kinase, partial [Candidatus Omnitrophica bacterium]|nr:HAMP domain-containing histidine kinase [Candidatus Omnitrophota bacterium]
RPLQGAFEYTIAFLLFKTTARQLRDLNHNLFERIEKDRRLSETSILAAGMAHEIKNPLTTLKTFAKFLPDRYQDSDFIKKCALHMQEETDRINNIVLQILEFASSKNLHVTETDASLLIDETISMLNINIVRKSIKISNQTPNPTILIIDKERFRQVLVNILLNAIEACSKNDSITISSTVTRRGFKHGVLFQLSDTGCGMSDEELTRLYDPFYSKNKQNGTGLGMNIVKRIVQDHKGDISVESKPGEGTTFFIFIPVR